MASGASVAAHQVVYCGNQSFSRTPAFMEPALASWLASGQSGASNRLLLAEEVDVRGLHLQGEKVLVVGGGMSAAQLACAALDHGAEQVTLMSRHNLKRQEFEVDPMYFGNKGLYNFK
eukprot:gene23584-28564_t